METETYLLNRQNAFRPPKNLITVLQWHVKSDGVRVVRKIRWTKESEMTYTADQHEWMQPAQKLFCLKGWLKVI